MGVGGRLAAAWRGLVGLAALLTFVQITIGIIGMPRGVSTWFTTANIKSTASPRTIVVLGGEGIPSESGLMRTYCAAVQGAGAPGVRFLCSLPADQDPDQSSVGRMRDELVLRGIPRASIGLEYRARNTHEQALAIREILGAGTLDEPLLVVTSPSHARRALLCFRKAGFRNVSCAVAVATSAEADMGRGVFLRYGFWNSLETQVRYARELVAMVYYKLRGWI